MGSAKNEVARDAVDMTRIMQGRIGMQEGRKGDGVKVQCWRRERREKCKQKEYKRACSNDRKKR